MNDKEKKELGDLTQNTIIRKQEACENCQHISISEYDLSKCLLLKTNTLPSNVCDYYIKETALYER